MHQLLIECRIYLFLNNSSLSAYLRIFCKLMIVYVLFVHKKSVTKRKVCIIFIKNKKIKKTPKKIFCGFLGGFFFGWVLFIANPAPRPTTSPTLSTCSSSSISTSLLFHSLAPNTLRYFCFITLKGIDQWEKRWVEFSIIRRVSLSAIYAEISNKLVQAPSCERHKTAPRILFLLFAIYNCFPITL